MQRVQDATASATLIAPPVLSGPVGYFTPGVPGISAATRFRYWLATMYQEELMSILAAAGVAADTTGTVFNQVLISIQTLIAAVPHGVSVVAASGSFVVPASVTMLDVEVWAGGSGSWASVTTSPGGGGSGGGYARKRITGLTPGASAAIVVGAGGTAGVSGTTPPGAGGVSSFTIGAVVVSATGGVVNSLGTVGAPGLGNLGGIGSGGDLNLRGDDGWGTSTNIGGFGGGAPLGGGLRNSGTVGTAGNTPGGGASGAGTGASSNTAYAAAAGGAGLCIVRW